MIYSLNLNLQLLFFYANGVLSRQVVQIQTTLGYEVQFRELQLAKLDPHWLLDPKVHSDNADLLLLLLHRCEQRYGILCISS